VRQENRWRRKLKGKRKKGKNESLKSKAVMRPRMVLDGRAFRLDVGRGGRGEENNKRGRIENRKA